MLKGAASSTGDVQDALAHLRTLSEGLFQSFGHKSPPIPEMSTLDQVRDFCNGISEKHPWHPLKGILKRRDFMSLSHSLFLHRKVIPKNSDPSAGDKYVDKMNAASSRPTASFLAYLRKGVMNEMRPGWDRKYKGNCKSLLFSTSGCLEEKRKVGGARRCNGDLNYYRRVALGQEVISNPVLNADVSVVRDNGKDRVVTVSSVEQYALKPWHKTLSDYLQKKDWLLHGDATAKKFKNFKRKEGEVFVSGDYESATDNVNLTVYKVVLDAIYHSSANIPHSVYSLAMKRSSLYLRSKKNAGWQLRGQLMGNFLSFPILCLINYLTFKYVVRRDVPVKINGDDIVFRGTAEEGKAWLKGVSVSGLKINRAKTMVDGEYFTLNSALFRGLDKAKVVPYIRSKPLFKTPESPHALASQFRAICVGISGSRAAYFLTHFLRRNGKMIGLTQRSLSRGLGLNVSNRVLRMSGLYHREMYYLRLPEETPLPGPTKVGLFDDLMPKGFIPYTRRDEGRASWQILKEISTSFGRACALMAAVKLPTPGRPLSKKEKVNRWVTALQKGTRPYRDKTYRHMMRLLTGNRQHNLNVDVPIRKQGKECLLLPGSINGRRKGVGWRPRWTDWA